MKRPSQLEGNLSSCYVIAQKKFLGLTGIEPMTSTIPVQCSTNWALKPCWKQVKSEFNFYPLY